MSGLRRTATEIADELDGLIRDGRTNAIRAVLDCMIKRQEITRETASEAVMVCASRIEARVAQERERRERAKVINFPNRRGKR